MKQSYFKWPRTPWNGGKAKFRRGFNDPHREQIANLIDELWGRDDLSDDAKRVLLRTAATLDGGGNGWGCWTPHRGPGCWTWAFPDGKVWSQCTWRSPDRWEIKNQDLREVPMQFGDSRCSKCAAVSAEMMEIARQAKATDGGEEL